MMLDMSFGPFLIVTALLLPLSGVFLGYIYNKTIISIKKMQ